MAGLCEADALDLSGKSVIFGAFSADHELLGTVRLTASEDMPGLLPETVSADDIPGDTFTFVDRFAVARGADRLTAVLLMKAIYRWSRMRKSDCLVALATASLAGHYARFGSLRKLGAGAPINVASDLLEPVYFLGCELATLTSKVAQHAPDIAAFYESPLGPVSLVSAAPVVEVAHV